VFVTANLKQKNTVDAQTEATGSDLEIIQESFVMNGAEKQVKDGLLKQHNKKDMKSLNKRE